MFFGININNINNINKFWVIIFKSQSHIGQASTISVSDWVSFWQGKTMIKLGSNRNTIGRKKRGGQYILYIIWWYPAPDFTLFSREKKSRIGIAFTFPKSEKWKIKFLHSFSRSESEIEMARDREREVKMKKISRHENLTGDWTKLFWKETRLFVCLTF